MENDLVMFFSVLLLIGSWRCRDGSALWNESFLLKLCCSGSPNSDECVSDLPEVVHSTFGGSDMGLAGILESACNIFIVIGFFLLAATSRLIYSRNRLDLFYDFSIPNCHLQTS